MRTQAPPLSGISFADRPETLYVDARKVADALGWAVVWEEPTQRLSINNKVITSPSSVCRLLDGTSLLAVSALRHLGGEVSWEPSSGTTAIKSGEHTVQIVRGEKRVEVDCATQRLRAWQGETLVLETPVSTGGPGHRTPTGDFMAGPIKERMHYSSLYNEAPMPYSIQVNGNIFLHGFASVPRFPASHGCVRIPLHRGNPARWLFEWIDRGTPIRIQGRWRG